MSYKGKDVGNVFHLRTPEDANSIAKLSSNKNAVIVGTSFVGEKHYVWSNLVGGAVKKGIRLPVILHYCVWEAISELKGHKVTQLFTV